MKRWELAKSKGLNWQVVLIQDLETDIKLLILASIKSGDDYSTTNKKVISLIKEAVNKLESETLKKMAKDTFEFFLSISFVRFVTACCAPNACFALFIPKANTI